MATWHLGNDTLSNFEKYPRKKAVEVGKRKPYPNMEDYKKALAESQKRKKGERNE